MPSQKTREALAQHPKCGAHSRRTGNPCRQPAMPNGRCRMHGGLSTGAPRGPLNGAYRHGRRTIEAQQERREARTVLRVLRELIRLERGK
jgi:hypothetical protein